MIRKNLLLDNKDAVEVSIKEVFMYNKNEYQTINRNHRLMAALSSSSYRMCYENLQRENMTYNKEEKNRIEKILSKNPEFLLIGDENYPSKLYDMPWPPLIIFYDGDLSLLNRPALGIVGSRRATAYGRNVTFELSRSLAKIGAVILSGGARGVDTIAHTAALKESGKTICVLGCGLDIVYPYENEKLFQEIRKEGLILSEYPKGFKPEKWTFPMRNRIIAALSSEIIVTEAARKSGSLHTATYAEELNRIVHSIPHEITSHNGVGNHILIEMGAKILYDRNEFIMEFLENNLRSIEFRINDLGLKEMNLSQSNLLKILGLSEGNEKNITKLTEKIMRVYQGETL